MTPHDATEPVRLKQLQPHQNSSPELVNRVATLLPGIVTRPTDAVTLNVPSGLTSADENMWACFLADPSCAVKRRGLLAQIRALLRVDALAKKEGKTLAEAARQEAARHRQVLETAWTRLLTQNRTKEDAMRWCGLFFSNLQTSRDALLNKVYLLAVRGDEMASEVGAQLLAEKMSWLVDRPDPRSSYGFVAVQGWAGTPEALHRLGRVVDENRAVLVTDAPRLSTKEQLRAAAQDGGILEAIPGEKAFHRHMILTAGAGRARHRFQGRSGGEGKDVYVDLSGPWFGMYLDNMAQGRYWEPPVGARNPIRGVDGVELDLLLHRDGTSHFLRHRLNPVIPKAAGSDLVVMWGPYALSKSGNGVQIGVAVVEMTMVRYAEWVVNQYGLLADLDEAQEVVKKKLSEFLVANSGHGRMFRAGSRVQVRVDRENRALHVEFDLLFREIAERASIRFIKPLKREETGSVSATSQSV